MESELSLLASQLEELEAVQACYEDHLGLTAAEEDTLKFAEAVAAGRLSVAAAADVPALSGTLRLPEVELHGAPVQLKFVLPRSSHSEARVTVLCNASRQEADDLQELASATVAECAADGQPCLLLLAGRLLEACRSLEEAEAAARQHAAEQQPAAPAAQSGGGRAQRAARQLALSRRCVWFHHIKNLNKRKSIIEWGCELGLGGYSKPGFPGVVIVETCMGFQSRWFPTSRVLIVFQPPRQGAGCDVDEYLARLRRLRWQAMAVRGEEDVQMSCLEELAAARRLARGVQELGEEEMGRLAAACRAAGLEALFLTALKLDR